MHMRHLSSCCVMHSTCLSLLQVQRRPSDDVKRQVDFFHSVAFQLFHTIMSGSTRTRKGGHSEMGIFRGHIHSMLHSTGPTWHVQAHDCFIMLPACCLMTQ